MSDLIRCERCRCLTSPRLRPDGCRICMLERHGHRIVETDLVAVRGGRTMGNSFALQRLAAQHRARQVINEKRSAASRWLPRCAMERQRRPVDELDDDDVGLDWWLRMWGSATHRPSLDTKLAAGPIDTEGQPG